MALASIYELVTPQWVKDTFLRGLDNYLQDEDGIPFPESMYEQCTAQAVASVQSELDLCLDVTTITQERQDWNVEDIDAGIPLYVFQRPLHSVQALRWKYGQLRIFTVPSSWINILNPVFGRMHVIPTALSPSVTLTTNVFPYFFSNANYMPGWWDIDYTAGFRYYKGSVVIAQGQQTATVTFAADETFLSSAYAVYTTRSGPTAADLLMEPQIVSKGVAGFTIKLPSVVAGTSLTVNWIVSDLPADLRQVLGIRAALLPLFTAGDLVFGAGVQSRQIGVDGLSQQLSTTKAGAAGGAFAGRVNSLQTQALDLMNNLRGKYRQMNMMGV
jgi:hypothetical protein